MMSRTKLNKTENTRQDHQACWEAEADQEVAALKIAEQTIEKGEESR